MPALVAGGAEKVMLLLAESFIARDIEVDLVVTTSRGELRDRVPSGVRIVSLGASRIALSLLPLSKYMLRERPVVILSAMTPANCIAQLARLLSRCKSRLYVVEHTNINRYASEVSSIEIKVLMRLVRWLYKQTDGVIAVSHGAAKSLSKATKMAETSIHVIYNPVISAEMFEKANKPKELALPGSTTLPLIVTAGRLSEAKDHQTLIEAFVLLQQKLRAQLCILGEGPNRKQLEKLILDNGLEKNVFLVGYVENPYPYFNDADVFVLSSTREGLPTVLIEALAMKLPVVSTDCPSGPREVLNNGDYGALVPVGKPAEMANAILAILEGRSNFAEPDLEQYSVESACQHYFELVFQEEPPGKMFV